MKQNSTVSTKQSEYFRIFIAFFILFAILTKPIVFGWNDGSRMAQIQAIVEHGSFIIDNSIFQTGDKYFYNNHFYSDKPPILALYASPFYFVLRLFGLSFEKNLHLACYLLVLLSIGLLSILGLIVFRRILREFLNISSGWADLITFVAGAGTLILPYSLLFNNHVSSGVFILLGFYFHLKLSRDSKPANAAYSGLFFSLAGGVDINCFLFIPFMLVSSFRKSLKSGLIFGLSCVPVIALYLFLNVYVSGSLIPPAMNAPLWEYPGSSFSSDNLSGLATHDNILVVLFYAFHMLIGNRGLISHTPILLFSFLGIFFAYHKMNWKFQYKAEYSYILLASLLYIFFYLIRTTNYSAWAFGVRWFASLMLIFCLPIACLESKLRSSKTLRLLFIGVSTLSIFLALVGSYSPMGVGTDTPPLVAPENTIFLSLRAILSDFYIVLTNPSMRKAVRLATLLLGTFATYFFFYGFVKKLESTPDRNQDQYQEQEDLVA